ncbi:MAG: RT0821/Lpp0805 family surface protein [Chromatiales bacterium]|jgi:surface antigen
MRLRLKLSLLLLLGLCLPSVQALNLKWLEFSPVKYFTEKDWELLRHAARTALNDRANGESVKWRNEQSGHYGSLTPISRLEVDGRPCRDLVIRNFAGGVSGGGTYRICRMEDGDWKLLGGKLQD